jgi:hypothetical protein
MDWVRLGGGNFIPLNSPNMINSRTVENRSGGIAPYDSQSQLQRPLRPDPVMSIGWQLGPNERLERGIRIEHLSFRFIIQGHGNI